MTFVSHLCLKITKVIGTGGNFFYCVSFLTNFSIKNRVKWTIYKSDFLVYNHICCRRHQFHSVTHNCLCLLRSINLMIPTRSWWTHGCAFVFFELVSVRGFRYFFESRLSQSHRALCTSRKERSRKVFAELFSKSDKEKQRFSFCEAFSFAFISSKEKAIEWQLML